MRFVIICKTIGLKKTEVLRSKVMAFFLKLKDSSHWKTSLGTWSCLKNYYLRKNK